MGPLLLCTLALASPGEPPSGASLPELREAPPAAYPAEALAAGLSSVVVLRIEVGADGSVLGAEVDSSGGAAFDDAAVRAARSFRFDPARDADGRAIAAAILYRMVFEPASAPAPSIEGEVRAAGTREGLASFSLVATRGERRVPIETLDDGSFLAVGLEPGTWTLSSDEPAYVLDPVEVTVSEGAVVTARLFPVLSRPWADRRDGASEEIVVVGERQPPQLTERRLSQEEVRYLPGTNGDVVRVVQNLPGVARPPLNIGQLVIRGTSPEDSAYYLDGSRIPNVFHFAGFSTVLNGDAVAQIAFLPGNYGVRYGRTIGGAVDLRLDPDLPARSRGYAAVDLFQATLFAEQRIGSRTALTVSGRRSYADAVLNPVLNGLSSSNIRVPRYYDLQARLLGRTDRGTIDALFLLSDDRFRILGGEGGADEVQIGLSTRFQKLRLLSVESRGPWRHETSIIGGPESQSFALAPSGSAIESPITFGLRDEWLRAPAGEVGAGIRLGLDAEAGWYRYAFSLPALGEDAAADTSRIAPAAYVEPDLRLGPLGVVPGLRVDGILLGSGFAAASVDPRLAVRLALGRTTLEASAGEYSQFPTVRQAIEQPSLGPIRSRQLSAGLEQRLGRSLSIEAVAYWSELSGLVSGREDAFRFYSGPPPVGPLDDGPYANDGTGRILGVEGLLRWSDERTAAWISATVGRSTRVGRPGGERELFEYDQPVVITALGSRELPKRWRIGLRARYGSGNPYTPVENRYVDLLEQAYVPVYGPVDSARLPAFWSLDTRIDHDWVFRRWTLTAYLDLQNATNRSNVEVIGWTEDYRAEDPITGLPLVPAFGFRGEW